MFWLQLHSSVCESCDSAGAADPLSGETPAQGRRRFFWGGFCVRVADTEGSGDKNSRNSRPQLNLGAGFQHSLRIPRHVRA
ncbi:MAG: hypothetical protein QOF32_975 [Gammaproteobacteria bacterium]|jgi:hypothetical protein|nr:hypothetical protein [Gammaproteobacteria bacterium]